MTEAEQYINNRVLELSKENRQLKIEKAKLELDKNKLIKQVCDEIRKKSFATEIFCDDKSEIVAYTIYADTLDQIEQAKRNY